MGSEEVRKGEKEIIAGDHVRVTTPTTSARADELAWDDTDDLLTSEVGVVTHVLPKSRLFRYLIQFGSAVGGQTRAYGEAEVKKIKKWEMKKHTRKSVKETL